MIRKKRLLANRICMFFLSTNTLAPLQESLKRAGVILLYRESQSHRNKSGTVV